MAVLGAPLPRLPLPEDVEALVGDQAEVVPRARPPLPRGLHLVLELDDVLPQDEAGVEELLEDADADRDVMAGFSGVE